MSLFKKVTALLKQSRGRKRAQGAGLSVALETKKEKKASDDLIAASSTRNFRGMDRLKRWEIVNSLAHPHSER